MKPNLNPMMMTLVEERLDQQSTREPLAAFFKYRHLPSDQSELAFPFAELAALLIDAPKIAPAARKASLESLLDARLAIVPEAITNEPSEATEEDGEADDEPEVAPTPPKKPKKPKA